MDEDEKSFDGFLLAYGKASATLRDLTVVGVFDTQDKYDVAYAKVRNHLNQLPDASEYLIWHIPVYANPEDIPLPPV